VKLVSFLAAPFLFQLPCRVNEKRERHSNLGVIEVFGKLFCGEKLIYAGEIILTGQIGKQQSNCALRDRSTGESYLATGLGLGGYVHSYDLIIAGSPH
jgi:hypothetical protein